MKDILDIYASLFCSKWYPSKDHVFLLRQDKAQII
jgi:hypothetical protein